MVRVEALAHFPIERDLVVSVEKFVEKQADIQMGSERPFRGFDRRSPLTPDPLDALQSLNQAKGAQMFKNGMRPVHPGEVLMEDYIKPMGVSVRAVAIALHVPYSRLSEIVKCERGVSADTALRLERYFGSEAKGWLNLQAAYELRVAEIGSGKMIAKEIRPLALAV